MITIEVTVSLQDMIDSKHYTNNKRSKEIKEEDIY